ncbi:MAG: diaminopimelate decarboxylase [Verrucomicrobia bacterium]|nr:diaminopimelate decarboxylase [Verrucomicrobiota bacterium]MCG2679205.1 diaminopimelate decarboxylase [Kiritimatiellia bacterium]MBU4248598.1 diaminopimelate decarboxylase [Verrucomicrobiota bacterium]MBU4290060.1 diaminopimelate decarboxylase [Verrucomicrobiota bacterium]MBU4428922.1 diaminopimelate decarboxylase [Verrucomicrobiota bacterium]
MTGTINPKVIYLPTAAIQRAVRRYPTPFFLYEEQRIRENCRRFRDTFRKYFPSFAPLYAVKANTNPSLLKIIFSEGFGADASSEAEAWITRRLGGCGMYTGNYTTPEEFQFVLKTGGFQLNLDDISMLPTIRRLGAPEFLSFRVNPGLSQGGMKSLFLAGPDAKYGVPLEDIAAAYRQARSLGVKRFGIHAMTGSNVLDKTYFAAVAAKLLQIVARINREAGIVIERLNIGGGFGVPYRPEQKSLDLEAVARGVRQAFDAQCARYGITEPILMAEPGRCIMADTGWLIGRVHVIKNSQKTFVGIDAGMNDLPRPAIYDAYHQVTVLGKPLRGVVKKVNVVGRLCENNDQFARDRMLPVVKVGDFLVIHNAGAHAFAMAHNYNNRLRSAEYLLTRRGIMCRIRRAETIRDLFRNSAIPHCSRRGRSSERSVS